MNPLVHVDITLFFKIQDSEIYGGPDSLGYTETHFGGVGRVDKVDDAFIERQLNLQAEFHKVPIGNVTLISKEEYDLAVSSDSGYVSLNIEGDNPAAIKVKLGREDMQAW